MEETIYNKIRSITDIGYILTLSHRHDRHKHIFNQLYKIGNCTKDNWLNISYGTSFPYNDIIINAINTSGKGRFSKPNEFDCARNHYRIIKTAYDLGYNSVCVMEDDILFYNNKDVFITYLDNIPNDYDILMFGGFTTDPNIFNVIKSEYYWYKNTSIGIWNCSMYMLSRTGMDYYIKFMDKFLWVADGPFYKAPENSQLVNTYISRIPLVIQCDKDIISSDIRNKLNDNIDYKTQNLYESFVNTDDYL